MANDCLVTQLKGVVDDNSLPILGVITLNAVKSNSITSADNQQAIMMQYIASESGDISVENPGAVSNDPTTVDSAITTTFNVAASYTKVAFKNETYKIYVPNKYNLRYFIGRAESEKVPIFDINLREFDYAQNLQEIDLHYFIDGAKGELEYLSSCLSLTSIKLDSTSVSGDIKALGSLTSLATLRVSYTIIKGELTELASAQVVAGRTSGTLAVVCNAYITLNGTVVGQGTIKTITFNSSLPDGYSIA